MQRIFALLMIILLCSCATVEKNSDQQNEEKKITKVEPIIVWIELNEEEDDRIFVRFEEENNFQKVESFGQTVYGVPLFKYRGLIIGKLFNQVYFCAISGKTLVFDPTYSREEGEWIIYAEIDPRELCK